MSKHMTKAQFLNNYRRNAIKRGESARSVNRDVSRLAKVLRNEVVVMS